MKRKKLIALGLTLALVLALAAGCAGQKPSGGGSSPAPETTPPPETVTPTPTNPPAARPQVNLGLLKGPTGIGAAQLLARNDAGTSLNEYNVTLGSDPANDVVPKLVNGELDIAAVPTNLASTLFHKTEGGVKLLALNTLGVLYILEKGDGVHSLADLRGKTLYATGQGANPEYVLNFLLEQNGLTPGTDVKIEWKSSEEVTALMAAGEIDLCMLPVPAATGVLMKNQQVRAAVDLNDAWRDAGAAGTFTMGCMVVRTAFLEENPQAVEDFLAEYAESVRFMSDPASEAISGAESPGELVARYEITPNAQIARAAIPQANLVCITGADMREIADYYEVLWAANPTSIGGAIPDDSFYYIP